LESILGLLKSLKIRTLGSSQPEEPKDEEKVSDQLKKLRKSKNPNFSVLEKGKEEEKKTGS
jgi:hypothetical protein